MLLTIANPTPTLRSIEHLLTIKMVQPKEPNTYDKQLIALGRVLQTLREEENSDVLVDTVLTYLHSEFEYSLIWIGLYDRIEHRLFGKGGITPNGNASILRQRFLLSPGDVLEQVVIQQRPLAISNLQEELRAGEWRKAAQTFGVQGTVIFPIRYRDRCYGVVLLGTQLWGASPRSDEKARLSMILGELAASLHSIEQDWQRQQIKRPDEPLLRLLTKLQTLTGMGARLETVVEETHSFIQPTRTNIYWFEREQRYFWRRLGNRQRGFGEANNQPAAGITAQEVSSFYQALVSDQLVSIGEAHSSLKADTTSRLMQQIRARSLLAAPILFQEQLLGFLAVEGNEPRIWQEEEKAYLRGASQLVALTVSLTQMEDSLEQLRLDRALTAEVAHSIHSEDDWKTTLQSTAEQVCKRLRAERFVVLFYNRDLDSFEVSYQSHPNHRRSLPMVLPTLSEADFKLLEKSQDAVGLENLDIDDRLVEWRKVLLEMGTRAVVLCSTTLKRPLEGIVMICHESPRSWSRTEYELVRVISQQIGVILHQWQLQSQMEHQQKINQTIQWGLTTLQQTQSVEQLERSALQHLAQSLHVPLAALVTWQPGRGAGRLILATETHDRFLLNTDAVIPIHADSLIRWVMEQDGILPMAIRDVPADSRQWLSASGIGQLLLVALRTALDHEPTGVVLVADGDDRRWLDRHLVAFGTLANQLAWSRRYLALDHHIIYQRAELERLNWYKHRTLEELYRSTSLNIKRLSELGTPKDPLFATRQQQILRQMQDSLMPLTPIVQEEQWQIRTYSSSISLISLLKRALERVDQIFKQQQIWSQVHNETNLTVNGDITKIEFVLYEILVSASQRCLTGGRIDLWCRQIDNRWLELSITDNGQIEPRLIEELEQGRDDDCLAPSLLDHPPGLHLSACRSLMAQIGGEFHLYRLEDERTLSRLVLPLGPDVPTSKLRSSS
jgi:GAF domain-containing protein